MSIEATDGDGRPPEASDLSDRLPPPAFPPGRRRRAESGVEDAEETGIPDDAFISPDEPLPRTGRGIPEDAFISPDDPLVPVKRDEKGRIEAVAEVRDLSSGRSLGLLRDKPTIHELPYLLDQLAEKLHEKGEKALEAHSEMGHFQAALRSFLKGYLDGSAD